MSSEPIDWHDLSERQQHYLSVIYQVERRTMLNQRRQWKHHRLKPYPSNLVWWVSYDGGETVLRHALDSRYADTEATGIFESLQSLGLIECRYWQRAEARHPALGIELSEEGHRVMKSASRG